MTAHPDKRGEDSADATARMLPCPSCGDTDVDATFAAGVKGGEREERFCNAGCMVCGMMGPDSHTRRDAADRWNALPRNASVPSHARQSDLAETLQKAIDEAHVGGHEPTMIKVSVYTLDGVIQQLCAPSTTRQSGIMAELDQLRYDADCPTGSGPDYACYTAALENAHRGGLLTASATRRSVVDEVNAERERQVEKEGWDASHDDAHDNGGLANAAACYAATDKIYWRGRIDRSPMEDRGDTPAPRLQQEPVWPWEWEWWKPKDRRRDLIRAAALIVAEIERSDRANNRPDGGKQT